MPELGNPVSGPVAGSSPQTYTPGVNASQITVYNRAATEVWISVGGAATVNTGPSWFLPGIIGANIQISIAEQWEQGEEPQTALTLGFASSATISCWVQIDQ
jgi:hypothetical protein